MGNEGWVCIQEFVQGTCTACRRGCPQDPSYALWVAYVHADLDDEVKNKNKWRGSRGAQCGLLGAAGDHAVRLVWRPVVDLNAVDRNEGTRPTFVNRKLFSKIFGMRLLKGRAVLLLAALLVLKTIRADVEVKATESAPEERAKCISDLKICRKNIRDVEDRYDACEAEAVGLQSTIKNLEAKLQDFAAHEQSLKVHC